VSGHLGAVMALLPVEQPEALRRRLAVVAGEAAGLAAWLHYDLNDRRAMQGCYTISTNVLQQAGHPALSAYVQGFRSIVRAAEGEFHDALALARGAGGMAARSATATTKSWLAGLEARARAHLGDRAGCLRVLNRAEEAIERARPEDDPEWMDSFDHDRFLVLAGSCYREIGNLPVAERMLGEAMAALDSSHTRRRSELLLELGAVHLERRELDEACRFAGDSMAAAAEAGSVVGIRRVRLFRRQLDEWADTRAVVALDERLASFL
jgi:tetratricopeptide (TPR) repeat protein